MFFDFDMDFPTCLLYFAEDKVTISPNIELPEAETSISGDRYDNQGQVLMESAVIQSIDIQKSIPDAYDAESYAREYQKFTDKFNKKWMKKKHAKKFILSIFSDLISSFKDLKYKDSKNKTRKRALTGKKIADEMKMTAARARRRASIEVVRVVKHREIMKNEDIDVSQIFSSQQHFRRQSSPQSDEDLNFLMITSSSPRPSSRSQSFVVLFSPPSFSSSTYTSNSLPEVEFLYNMNQKPRESQVTSKSLITTIRNSRGIAKKSKKQLRLESQLEHEAEEKAKKKADKEAAAARKKTKTMKSRKDDVSQLADEFSQLSSSI